MARAISIGKTAPLLRRPSTLLVPPLFAPMRLPVPFSCANFWMWSACPSRRFSGSSVVSGMLANSSCEYPNMLRAAALASTMFCCSLTVMMASGALSNKPLKRTCKFAKSALVLMCCWRNTATYMGIRLSKIKGKVLSMWANSEAVGAMGGAYQPHCLSRVMLSKKLSPRRLACAAFICMATANKMTTR